MKCPSCDRYLTRIENVNGPVAYFCTTPKCVLEGVWMPPVTKDGKPVEEAE